MNIPEGSDGDLHIDLKQGKSLPDQVGLIQDLEDLLGCRVDFITVYAHSFETSSAGTGSEIPAYQEQSLSPTWNM